MFEVGDKIVCIDGSYSKLITNCIYTIKLILDNSHLGSDYNYYKLEESGVDFIGYSDRRFITLLEYRKLKLKKICSKLDKVQCA